MQKPDNIIQQKIQQLNELPEGPGFDPASTWQRMEEKLQQKPLNKKPRLRWAAVLIVMLAGGMVYFLSDNPASVNPMHTESATDLHPTKKNKGSITKIENSVSQNEKPAGTKKIIVREKKSTGAGFSTITDEKTHPGNAVIVSKEPVILPAIANTNTLVEPVAVVVAPGNSAIKKRLRVIHLNDIYQPEPAEIAKIETKKQQAEEVQETEPPYTSSPKPFWKPKTSARITISLNDNQ